MAVKRGKKATQKPARRPSRLSRSTSTPKASPAKSGFVGRDGSPVLDRYPPKDPSLLIRGPPAARPAATPASSPPKASPPPGPASSPTPPPTTSDATAAAATAPMKLIALEKPFDIDDFSQMLGETNIRVNVPREDLGEVLRRISDFMGFGIYVYAISVRPAATESLKQFVLELVRVDFVPERGDWAPFKDKGRSESPFGPSGNRT
jgi:hypothetical protein